MSFWSGKAVLVTGGTGFIGSHVVEMLLEEGARVTATGRRALAPFLKGVLPRIRYRAGDLNDAGFCEELADGQDAIMHLAARVGGVEYNRTHHASLFIANMRPFLNMLEAAHKAGVGRFLVTSSACVYRRDCTIPTPENEGRMGEPEATNAGYGWAKRMQEYVAAEFCAEAGLPVAIARPSNAYGPRDDFSPVTSHVIAALIRKVLSGQDPLNVWGSGEQTRSFLYVEDFARGLLLLAERCTGPEPVNIGTDQETTIRQLVELILEISGKSPEVRYEAARPGGQPRRLSDVRKMSRVLGWKPAISLAEGLRRTIRWYRENGSSA